MVVSALFVTGLLAFVDGIFKESVALQVLGAICLGGGIVLFSIKIGEEIHPVTAKWGIAGEVGEVVTEVDRHGKGVVRVRSELWSAKSEEHLPTGTKVRVTRVEGLLAWVARLDEGSQLPA